MISLGLSASSSSSVKWRWNVLLIFKTVIKIFCTVLFIHSSNKCMMTTFYMSCVVPGGKDGPSLLGGIVVQLLNHVQLFVTPWTAARQAFLSFITSQSLHKLMSIESLMLSNCLIPCHTLILPWSFLASVSFSVSQLFASGGQSIGGSASAWALPVPIQGWFPLGLTNLISLLFKAIYKIDGIPVLLELIFQWGWGRLLTN